MIDRNHPLSIARQAEVIGISRARANGSRVTQGVPVPAAQAGHHPAQPGLGAGHDDLHPAMARGFVYLTAVDLFEFIYRRSIQEYSVLRASLAAPDLIRTKYRQTLNELMQFVVFHGRTLDGAFAEVSVDAADSVALRRIANTELDQLEQYNCARYNLVRGMTQRWIDAGRCR